MLVLSMSIAGGNDRIEKCVRGEWGFFVPTINPQTTILSDGAACQSFQIVKAGK